MINPMHIVAVMRHEGTLDAYVASGSVILNGTVPTMIMLPPEELERIASVQLPVQMPQPLARPAAMAAAQPTPIQPPPSQPSGGAGTELKALLKDWLGIEASPTCGCNAMARKMDANGPDWCDGPGLPEILAVMRTEHGKRWQAKKTIIPWSDLGAKQLVKLACRRARAKNAEK